MERWPIQVRGVNLVLDAIDRGVRRPLLTSPTGTGKSVMVGDVIDRVINLDWSAILYTNRRMLVDQLSDSLAKAGILHGIRAAGYDGEDGDFPVQISSLPTEVSRVLKRGRWGIHGDGKNCIAIVDEAHLNAGDKAREILERHIRAGHYYLGVTATPLDLGDVYDELLIAGTTSDGFACGALVPCIPYDFAAPDLKGLRNYQEGKELSENQVRTAMLQGGREKLIGRVFDDFDQLNPTRRPTLLFAPGVPESIWFAEEFAKRGIKAAHIDGDDIWLDGEYHPSSRDMRKRLIGTSDQPGMIRTGEVQVLCNRFVCREGIDIPEISHMVAATVFGSLQTYLQSIGRGLRACKGKTAVTLQDHGGNCFRHGSPNEDREWTLEQTASMAYGLRAKRLREQPWKQPFRCPACGRMWVKGTVCNVAHGGCGHALDRTKRSREVVMADGTIRLVRGDFFKPRPVCRKPNGAKLWEQMYYRSITRKGSKSFAAAFALFSRENSHQWPDPSWPLMPTREADHFRLVADVPVEHLTGDPELHEKVRQYRAKRETANA